MDVINKKNHNIHAAIMDEQAINLLIGLRRIGQNPHGGKLNTHDGDIDIYMGTWKEWISRNIFYRYGETQSREFLMKFYSMVNQKCRNLILMPNTSDIDNIIYSFVKAIEKSLKGIENLRVSYNHKASIISDTDYILDDIVNPLLAILYKYQNKSYYKFSFTNGILIRESIDVEDFSISSMSSIE
jgi:hypothetical protein